MTWIEAVKKLIEQYERGMMTEAELREFISIEILKADES